MNTSLWKRLSRGCCVLFAFSLAGPASAATLTWDGSAGNWDTNSSWTGGPEPTASDEARINAGTVDVTMLGEVADEVRLNNGTLNILAGGSLSSGRGNIGRNAGTTGAVTVTGAGAMWTSNEQLRVGREGTGILDINNGGAVVNAIGLIGLLNGSTGTAAVTGAGSTWNNTSGLYVGGDTLSSGGTGTLNVLDSGLVDVTGPMKIWNNGTVILDGGSIHAQGGLDNTSGGTLDHRDGTLTVTGSGFAPNAGGPTDDYVINGLDALDTPLLVIGSGGSTALGRDLYVGDTDQGQLRIEAGGAVSNRAGYIGFQSGSTGTATVTGAGSTWNNTGGLYVGGDTLNSGGAGTLNVLDNGLVDVTGPMKIWNNGTVILDGGAINARGGLDNTSGGILDHRDGTLTVTGGVFAPNAGGPTDDYVINGLDALDTPTVVIGSGGSTAVGRDLYVGDSDQGQLLIEAGSAVSNSAGFIGRQSGSTGTATVTGAGSIWTNTGGLYVGGDTLSSGGTGTLDVLDSGQVDVNGPMNIWNNGTIILDGGSINAQGGLDNTFGGTLDHRDGTLTVTGGVFAPNAGGPSDDYLINGLDALDTPTVVIGNGGSTAVGGDLYVGDTDQGQLRIEGGGTVSNNVGFIGNNPSSTGTVTVTGAGSTWNNTNYLLIGHFGDGTLHVEDGGQVVMNSYGIIGLMAGSTGTATLTTGSMWTTPGDLVVGAFGDGTLYVEAGSAMSNRIGYIGDQAGSTSSVTVTGAGSTWTNTGELYFGFQGGNGTLNVEDGGVVSNSDGLIGLLNGSTGTATVTGAGSTWNNTSGLYVGGDTLSSGGTGTLNVLDSGLVDVTGPMKIWNNGTVILDGGSIHAQGGLDNTSGGTLDHRDGTLTVTGGVFAPNAGGPSDDYLINGLDALDTPTVVIGNGGSTALGRDLYVGHTDQGQLRIEDGGTVSNNESYIGHNPSSTGTATVTGAGSTWNSTFGVRVGYSGTGTLNVEDGGTVDGDGLIGVNTNSTGTATVTGAGSTWNNAFFMIVGYGGTGTLNVEDGGAVSNITGHIGLSANSTGTATVTGAGSMWTNTDTLSVGASGTGTLNVEAGGVVSSSTGHVADSANSTGTATVTGAGSTWTNTGGLYVGGFTLGSGGTGTLNVLDSGLVDVTGPMKIWNNGTVILDGGTVNATSIDHTSGGTFDFLAGTLSVDSFLGTLDQDGGTLAPGNSPGITTVSADYNLNAGSIAIELSGLIAGTEHDQVSVAGALNLGLASVLDVTLINAFAPNAGDSFDILDFGSITGAFNTINLPTLNSGLGWDTDSLLIDGTLSVAALLVGDLNGDSFVGIADLNIVLGAWNQNVTAGIWELGDPSGDGFVGIDDLNAILSNWNAGTPPQLPGANIPEPATLALLTLGMATMSRRRSP